MINYSALFIGLAIVIGILFAMAALGMSASRNTGMRPPELPPGQLHRRAKLRPGDNNPSNNRNDKLLRRK